MARLFSDENFPQPVVEWLRHHSHDVLTIGQIGRAGQGVGDDEILDLASRDSRAVLTINRRDFFRLHRTVPGHAGIVICTFDPDFASLAERIHAALSALDQLEGRLVRVIRPGPEPRRRRSTPTQ